MFGFVPCSLSSQKPIRNWVCQKSNGSSAVEDSERGIHGMRTIFPACFPPSISHSMTPSVMRETRRRVPPCFDSDLQYFDFGFCSVSLRFIIKVVEEYSILCLYLEISHSKITSN